MSKKIKKSAGTLGLEFLESIEAPSFKNGDSTIVPASENRVLTLEESFEKCLEIRENVKTGKPENTVVNLGRKIQYWENEPYSFANALLKTKGTDGKEECIHINENTELNALVFVGGSSDEKHAFVAKKGENGKDILSELNEFHSLAISKNSKTDSELGIMTSFNKKIEKSFTGILEGSPDLNSVKSALISGNGFNPEGNHKSFLNPEKNN